MNLLYHLVSCFSPMFARSPARPLAYSFVSSSLVAFPARRFKRARSQALIPQLAAGIAGEIAVAERPTSEHRRDCLALSRAICRPLP